MVLLAIDCDHFSKRYKEKRKTVCEHRNVFQSKNGLYNLHIGASREKQHESTSRRVKSTKVVNWSVVTLFADILQWLLHLHSAEFWAFKIFLESHLIFGSCSNHLTPNQRKISTFLMLQGRTAICYLHIFNILFLKLTKIHSWNNVY